MKNTIEKIENEYKSKIQKNFRVGDTVNIQIWILEGDKKRIQNFEGIVIAIKKSGISTAFTVRKISHGKGVERTFPVYSPIINKIEVKKKGFFRKSKLYFLRKNKKKKLIRN
ncbi:50S ribosomal protein L19 [bacterium endosymbiont of Pedicinus badii]|uniref:50S ribosomal protein L19 n=1 Tax=bacterium endosymbiont of Pedicinus badii TaxID=1719126 RepID=UPI0009BAA5C6|nr:50S ribosomal protein L19 [bacterium endosymbiont of Pedicinus badii]OQM34251.1 50S ribosomal protein L19 [bacterium endosymbiont of Pedicinus badii]